MRGSPGRQKPSHCPDAETDDRREEENAKIRRKLIDPRNFCRQKTFERIKSPNCDQQAGEAAEDSDQRAFRQ